LNAERRNLNDLKPFKEAKAIADFSTWRSLVVVEAIQLMCTYGKAEANCS